MTSLPANDEHGNKPLTQPTSPSSHHQDEGGDTSFEDAVEDQKPDKESLGAEDRIEVHAFLERKTWIQDKIKVRTRRHLL